MKKVIIWGMGRDYEELRLLFQYYEMINAFSVIGITSEIDDYLYLDGYPFFKRDEIVKLPVVYKHYKEYLWVKDLTCKKTVRC